MEANIPFRWKPLNLEQYDEITDPNKHLKAFLTQVNLYTNDNVIEIGGFGGKIVKGL